jgi:plasmid stabilization system protein ParE
LTKPLKIAPWVVPDDLQGIYDYHKLLSIAKADRIVEEFDRIVDLLEVNPLLFHERESGWRVYPFNSGTYLLYYRELDMMWLIAGVFHARRHPFWIRDQLSGRVST